ncbi:MAG: Fpg/Nei family DNA glycosylase [Chitinophagaceae bacterium]|nr:MAG: Fpg/Nei family DNA glycosylase [Chitinophagaceae bacterium]
MPEIPDIEVFRDNINEAYAGKTVKAIRVRNGRKLPDSARSLSRRLAGKKLSEVGRSGKELRWHFSDGTVLGMHLMLTGDIFPFEGRNKRPFTIVEIQFADGSGIALTDRMRNAHIRLDPDDKAGIDALDPKLNFKRLKDLLQRKAVIKNVLLDQDTIRGIGNGYSDEILWKSRISPFSIAQALPDSKVRELARNIRQVLKSAISRIRRKYPGRLQGEVRDFMQVHAPKLTHSPTGFPIKVVKRGMLKTYYTEEQVLYR